MIRFDEVKLIVDLEKLSTIKRIAFAAAVSTRAINNYEFYASRIGQEDNAPSKIVRSIWDDIFNYAFDLKKWEIILNEILDLIPEEDGKWTIWHALVDDSLSSLAYTIRCIITQSSQEAAWAARRVYEAVDQVVISQIEKVSTHDQELMVLSNELVQRELKRQERDMHLIKTDAGNESINRIFEYSKIDFLYREGEEFRLID